MILLDTGYLVAVLRPRDELHARAAAWSRFLREPFLITEYVLWETINHFSEPIDRPKIHRFLDEVGRNPAYEIVAASGALYSAGLDFHRRHADKSWSLTDCISFHVMRMRAMSRALAHDQHFEQAGFEALLRQDP
jgi:uncharacterized protein